MSGSIEILPKQYISGSYTQSVAEAVDCGNANFAAIQVWIDSALTSSQVIEVWMQEASINDDGAYVDWNGAKVFQLDNTGKTTDIGTALQFSRYVRLRFVFSGGAPAQYLRAVIVLKDNP